MYRYFNFFISETCVLHSPWVFMESTNFCFIHRSLQFRLEFKIYGFLCSAIPVEYHGDVSLTPFCFKHHVQLPVRVRVWKRGFQLWLHPQGEKSHQPRKTKTNQPIRFFWKNYPIKNCLFVCMFVEVPPHTNGPLSNLRRKNPYVYLLSHNGIYLGWKVW